MRIGGLGKVILMLLKKCFGFSRFRDGHLMDTRGVRVVMDKNFLFV